MIDKKLFKIVDNLKSIMDAQKTKAHEALLSLPDGETKDKLKILLREASTGRLSQQDAQRELEKIMKNAS